MYTQYAGLLPGGSEWVLILLAILVLFGGKKIPELMKGLGQGIREFNAAKATIKDEIEQGMKEKPVVPTTPPADTHTEKKD